MVGTEQIGHLTINVILESHNNRKDGSLSPANASVANLEVGVCMCVSRWAVTSWHWQKKETRN